MPQFRKSTNPKPSVRRIILEAIAQDASNRALGRYTVHCRANATLDGDAAWKAAHALRMETNAKHPDAARVVLRALNATRWFSKHIQNPYSGKFEPETL